MNVRAHGMSALCLLCVCKKLHCSSCVIVCLDLVLVAVHGVRPVGAGGVQAPEDGVHAEEAPRAPRRRHTAHQIHTHVATGHHIEGACVPMRAQAAQLGFANRHTLSSYLHTSKTVTVDCATEILL